PARRESQRAEAACVRRIGREIPWNGSLLRADATNQSSELAARKERFRISPVPGVFDAHPRNGSEPPCALQGHPQTGHSCAGHREDGPIWPKYSVIGNSADHVVLGADLQAGCTAMQQSWTSNWN